MAPKRRGRTKKVPDGGSRRDAATEAMRGFGFEDDLIETTLNELLEEYTEEGWVLIEEYYYRVLLDAILAKQEQAGEIAVSTNADDGGPVGCITGTVATGPSSMALPSSELKDTCEDGSNAIPAVSTKADDGGPIGCIIDTVATGPSSMALPSSELKDTCDEGSDAIDVEPLSVVSGCKDNDVKPSSDGVELQYDKPPESLDEHVSYSKPAHCGESSCSKDMDLGEDDQNGSIHPRISSQFLPTPLRRRRRREHKPCYGWLDDDEDEDEEEDYKEHRILQLEAAPLPGDFQRSPQRRRVQQEQSKVVSIRSDEGDPVGYIMDTSAVASSSVIPRYSELKDTYQIEDGSNISAAEPLAIVPGIESNDTKLFSDGGVKLLCDMSLEPFGRNASACSLHAQDGESSGSEDMDFEDDDRFDSERPPLAATLYQVQIKSPPRQRQMQYYDKKPIFCNKRLNRCLMDSERRHA